MVDFYKHDIPGWMDGTESLSANEYRAYHVICQLIYLNEGPIALNERGIAGRCNMRLAHFRTALDALCQNGKLKVVDGVVFNDRCERELELIRCNRKNAAKGGRASSRRANSVATPILDAPFEILDASSESLDDFKAHVDDSYTRQATDKPLKNSEPPQAALATDVSLREESRGEELTLFASARAREVAGKGISKADREVAFLKLKAAYPKRDGPQDWPKARIVFDRVVSAGTNPDEIIRGAELYAADVRRRGEEKSRFVKQARTWLNGEVWRELMEAQAEAAAPASNGSLKPSNWPSALPDPETCFAAWRAGKWPGTWGFPPGDPSCRIPPDVVTDWRARQAQQAAA